MSCVDTPNYPSGSATTSYAYDDANRLTTTTFANGDVETRTWNAATADLTSILNKTAVGGTTTDSHAYTSYGDGRRNTETLLNGSVLTDGYDNEGQLTSEARTGTNTYSASYTYDAAGNRATKTIGAVTDTYTYNNAEQLSSTTGGKSFTYDNAGNCTSVTLSGVTTTLTWDAEERLLTNTEGTSSYSYNGLSQRVAKTENGSSGFYTLEDDAIDSPILNASGTINFHWAQTLLGDTRTTGANIYYHADALGTTRSITNASQTKTDTLDTDAFGLTVTSTGSTSPMPFKFGGQSGYWSHGSTGLLRLGYRYYDPSTGRFISRDPACDEYNWYTYCENDPVNCVDPEGLEMDQDPQGTPSPTPAPTPTPTPKPPKKKPRVVIPPTINVPDTGVTVDPVNKTITIDPFPFLKWLRRQLGIGKKPAKVDPTPTPLPTPPGTIDV
jgi:RHS repeat-associated protein